MKNTKSELEADLLDFEKLMNSMQIFTIICLGLCSFLPYSRSANGDIDFGYFYLLMFFYWTVPVLIFIYLFMSNHRLMKAVIYFLMVLGSLPVLFLLYFAANFKSTPLVGYYAAQISIIVLIVCWLILGVTTLKTAKIRRTESETQAKIKKIMRLGLLGILLTLGVFQVSWSILFKYPEDGVIACAPPPGYDRGEDYDLHEAINGFMYITIMEDFNERPLIAIISMPSFVNMGEEKIHAQVRSSIEDWSWTGEQSYNMKFAYGQEAIIRGQQVPLLFYRGTNESGVPMKQLFSGIFMGKENRKVMLFIAGKEARWNQKEIDAFIKSIK